MDKRTLKEMTEVLDPLGNIVSLVDFTLSLCFKIYKLAQNVKANKERCQQVAQRVKALEELVLAIKKRGPRRISATVENSLRELCTTLTSAKTLMKKYSQSNAFMSFVKSSSHEDKFYMVDKSLTDTFQVLSGALLIEQGDMLHKVYTTVKASRKTRRPIIPTPVSSSTAAMTMNSPTTAMPLPSTMPTMTMNSPTTAMPLPSTMPTMAVYGPTPATPYPSTMPTMTMNSPTPATPYPSTMPTMTMNSPTTAMPLPSTMPTMAVYGPTPATPYPSTMPTMTVYSPTTPMPVCSIISTSRSSISLPGPMASIPFSTNMASNPAINIMGPMTFSPQNATVVTTYGYGSFFS
ncbi:mucin-2-like [Epinephelus fuscoguttatus]|uniref:mucin-2-like n=1 Tax=Epinephelus fuscoguttatus TaxID=293821 RepID=UPI0020D1ED91|nr:mucin-2-like [Epinephelus fuscoguttatus]